MDFDQDSRNINRPFVFLPLASIPISPYNHTMNNSNDNVRRNLEILKILEEAIEQGPWDQSLFLRATGDKLRKLRDQFKSTAKFIPEESAQQEFETIRDEDEEQIEVYISLYNSAGSEIRNWEKLLNNLKTVLITRPVLATEKDAKELLRSKLNKKNEAYIAVYIDKSDVMSPIGGITPKDTLGHELLVLKENTVKTDNITRFVHVSGEYRFKRGHLIRLAT